MHCDRWQPMVPIARTISLLLINGTWWCSEIRKTASQSWEAEKLLNKIKFVTFIQKHIIVFQVHLQLLFREYSKLTCLQYSFKDYVPGPLSENNSSKTTFSPLNWTELHVCLILFLTYLTYLNHSPGYTLCSKSCWNFKENSNWALGNTSQKINNLNEKNSYFFECRFYLFIVHPIHKGMSSTIKSWSKSPYLLMQNYISNRPSMKIFYLEQFEQF